MYHFLSLFGRLVRHHRFRRNLRSTRLKIPGGDPQMRIAHLNKVHSPEQQYSA